MFAIGSDVQIVNHADAQCNGQYGVVKGADVGYTGRLLYYTVELHESRQLCICTEDELMEG